MTVKKSHIFITCLTQNHYSRLWNLIFWQWAAINSTSNFYFIKSTPPMPQSYHFLKIHFIFINIYLNRIVATINGCSGNSSINKRGISLSKTLIFWPYALLTRVVISFEMLVRGMTIVIKIPFLNVNGFIIHDVLHHRGESYGNIVWSVVA